MPIVDPVFEVAKNVGDRLKQARLHKGFASATDAAKTFGWNENTYRSHENGMRGLKPAYAKRYAQAFDADATWIIFGEESALLEDIHSAP